MAFVAPGPAEDGEVGDGDVLAGEVGHLGQAPVGEDESLLTALYDSGLADDLGGSS